jgi:hypothetical protein
MVSKMTPQEFKHKLKEYKLTQKAFAKNVLGITEKALAYHLKKKELPKFIENAFLLHFLKRDGVEVSFDSIIIKRNIN